MKIIPFLLLGFLCFLHADDRPNVIFILADDIGHSDVAAYYEYISDGFNRGRDGQAPA